MNHHISLSDFQARAGAKLLTAPPQQWRTSDDDMNQKNRLIPPGIKPKAAAVLVPVVKRAQELTVLLTRRSATLAKHGGQIAFPGGRIDGEETVLQAALRETTEETGIKPQYISPLGYLDAYLTVTNYFVTPVVALIDPGFTLALEASEVDEAFEIPLSFLMSSQNCEKHERTVYKVPRCFYAYHYQEYYIWGATAGMIKTMSDRLYDE